MFVLRFKQIKGSRHDVLFDKTVTCRLNHGHHCSTLLMFFPPVFFCLCVCYGLHCPLQDPLDVARSVIVIRSVVPGGVADSHGGLLPGDQLVFVNDTHLDTCSLAQAVEVLKSAPPGTVYLGIRKPLAVCNYGPILLTFSVYLVKYLRLGDILLFFKFLNFLSFFPYAACLVNQMNVNWITLT